MPIGFDSKFELALDSGALLAMITGTTNHNQGIPFTRRIQAAGFELSELRLGEAIAPRSLQTHSSAVGAAGSRLPGFTDLFGLADDPEARSGANVSRRHLSSLPGFAPPGRAFALFDALGALVRLNRTSEASALAEMLLEREECRRRPDVPCRCV